MKIEFTKISVSKTTALLDVMQCLHFLHKYTIDYPSYTHLKDDFYLAVDRQNSPPFVVNIIADDIQPIIGYVNMFDTFKCRVLRSDKIDNFLNYIE